MTHLDYKKDQQNNLLKNMPDGFAYFQVITDKKGNPVDYICLQINPAFTKLTGLNEEMVQGKKVIESYPEIEKIDIDWLIIYSQLLASEKPIQFESYFEMFNKWLEVTAYLDKPEHVAIVVKDITERKKTEANLLAEKHEKEIIINNLSEQIAFIDPEMRIIWANSKTVERHKLNENNYKGQICYEVYHQFNQPCPDCPVVEALETGKTNHSVHKSTEDKCWQVTSIPVRDHHETIIGVLYTALNITERKIAEEKIQILNEKLEKRVKERTIQLEAANRELEAFSYSASHDLRGPLNRISGFSEALLEDYPDQLDYQGKEYLQRIKGSCDHMKLLIDDFFKLSRVSQQQISREPVEMSTLAWDCLKELQNKDPHRVVEKDIAPNLVVEGDPTLLQIALQNLFDNAWKYTSSSDTARIEFGSTFNGGKKTYYIGDNGAGFDMKHAEKLFTAFQRLHDPKKYPGTGIGLSIVSRIISRHGGEIWAEGEPGKGACFFFTLP